jgi:hypothetical protein
MGTNFYIKGHRNNDDPKYHIGKRSAAGVYCWDCGVTLCAGGASRVHYGDKWLEACPKCGKLPGKEPLDQSCAGREIGFNKAEPKKKTGVSSCSSFTWARDLGSIKKIVDEYGTEYTLKEFESILSECPIQYRDRIGKEFF